MTLTELIDNQVAAIAAAETIPCQENEPEMWFADTPDGVEFAKSLCGTCPARGGGGIRSRGGRRRQG